VAALSDVFSHHLLVREFCLNIHSHTLWKKQKSTVNLVRDPSTTILGATCRASTRFRERSVMTACSAYHQGPFGMVLIRGSNRRLQVIAHIVGFDHESVMDEGRCLTGNCLVTHRPLCYSRRSYPAVASGVWITNSTGHS
jgi:hypothetical protein